MLRLAQRFGIPAGELLHRMSGFELAAHLALEDEEPQGWPANRLLFGTIACAVRNAQGGKRNGQAYTIADFFPEPRFNERDEKPQTVEEQIAILRSIFG